MIIQLGSLFRNRIQWRRVGILVVFSCLPGSVVGQTNQQVVVQDAIQRPADQAVVDEINSIRSQLGGGIEKQLQDLPFGNLSNEQLKDDFDQELKRQLVKRQLDRDQAATGGSVIGQTVPKGGKSVESGFISPSEFFASSGHPPVPAVRPLRSAARRMDEIAAELEEVGLYQEADSIREQARSFWLKARQMENKGQSACRPLNR